MKGRNFLVAGLVVALCLLAGAHWYARRDNSLRAPRSAGIIRIGYAVEAPYAYVSADGAVTGESVEVARVVAARLNIKSVEWVQTDFWALLDDLNRERFDIVAAGMFITPEREQKVSFSHPTFQVKPGLLVPRGNPHRIRSYADLGHRRNLRLAVLDGSVERVLLEPLTPLHRMLVVTDAVAGRAAVLAGTADGLALSEPTVRWMANHEGGQALEAIPLFPGELPPGVAPGRGAFAFRKADRDLLEAWNTELQNFLGTPGHLNLIKKFEFLPREVPVSARAGRGAP